MKKFVTIMSALIIALMVPVLAFADPSPNSGTAQGTSGSQTLNISGIESGGLTVEGTTKQASNVVLATETEKVLVSFEVTTYGNFQMGPNGLTFTFSLGQEYAGASVKVFIEHDDGETEVQSATVAADGTVTIPVDKLSIFTVVVDESTMGNATSNADTSSKSPQTGVSVSAAQVVTGVSFVAAAACAAYAVRKVTVK